MSVIGIFILFLIGSLIGWIIEVFYRNIISKEKINPGFLKGPYLPIYGFAVLLLYLIVNSRISLIYKIILLVILPTLMELSTGIIFEKYFKIKLWDYSGKFLNYKGIICPQFSFYWVVLSMIYLFVLQDFTDSYFLKILSSTNYIFFYGAIAGVFLLDEFYAFNMAFKIRRIVKKMKKKRINFNKFKKASSIFRNLKQKIEDIMKDNLFAGN